MNDLNVIDELKNIDVLIGKKMFKTSKNETIAKPPSPLQFKVLAYLISHKDESVCQRDLENSLNVSKSTISDVILTMEKNGIIKRNSSLTDARSKIISFTDSSLKRFNEMQNVTKKVNEKLIQNIKKEDLIIFFNVLNQMKNNLNERDEQ